MNTDAKGIAPSEVLAPHLSISAHVVVQLGEELVTDIEQALLELAKNAYDADSPTCEIKVDPNWRLDSADPASVFFADEAHREIGRVRIRDYGTGLTEEAVANGWLRISASLKRVGLGVPKEKTAKGRTPVGDKGLGRLATMKLGRVLRLKTAVEGEETWRTVMFSWDEFTADRTLDQVQVVLGTDSNEVVDAAGTIVEVLGLHEQRQWTDVTYVEKYVVPHLSSLVNPFQRFDNFEISLNAGRHIYELHSLDEEVLNLAAAKFVFKWDGKQLSQEAFMAPELFRGERGEGNSKRFQKLFSEPQRSKLIAWLTQNKRLKERGLRFDAPAPWFCRFEDRLEGEPFPSDKKFPGAVDPGPFEATLFYFMYHDEVKLKLTAAQVSTETLQAMSQVAIYRDGFRVRAHKDWLRLSEGTTSGSSFYGLRPANVLGYFAVSNENNPTLVEKSDREGFVDNAEFRGFMTLGLRSRDYSNAVLETARKSVRDFLRSVEDLHGGSQGREDLVSSINRNTERAERRFANVEQELADATQALTKLAAESKNPADAAKLTGSVAALEAKFSSVAKGIGEIGNAVRLQASTSQRLAELSDDEQEYAGRLLDAAAVGLAARSLAHELQELVRQLRSGIGTVADVNRQLKNPSLTTAIRILNGTTRELGKIVATIDPMLPGTRSLKEKIKVAEFLTEFVEARQASAERANIVLRIQHASQSDLTVKFSRARLLQVVENLYQNSLYWLRQGPWPQKDCREILVQATPTGFLWADSGPGIRPSLEASIFDAYVSDKPRAEASGIGLHVVSTFLMLEKCSITLTEKRNPLGRRYEFEVNLTGAQMGPQREL